MGKSSLDKGAEFSSNEIYAHIYQDGESHALLGAQIRKGRSQGESLPWTSVAARVPREHVLCTRVYANTRL